jgi:exopolysaccharide biosynthesis polyprenyl glycosylphosphotransferase
MDTTVFSHSTVNPRPLIAPRTLALLLLGGDVLGLALMTNLAAWVRLGHLGLALDWIFCGFVLVVVTVFYIADTYRPDTQISGLRAPARILLGSVIVVGLMAALIYLMGPLGRSHPLLFRGTWIPGFAGFVGWAIGLRLTAGGWMRSHIRQTNWAVLGESQGLSQFESDFFSKTSFGKLTVLSKEPRQHRSAVGVLTAKGMQTWTGIVVANPLALSEAETQQLMQARLQGMPIYSLLGFYETYCYKVPAALLQDTWFVLSEGFQLVQSRVSLKLKRLMDIGLAGVMLLLFAPVMGVAAIAIKLNSRGPIFYSQQRTGLYCQPFRVYKFRSMYQDAERRGAQWASQRDARITGVGYWLRLMRIDELPQLWNVLKGEMSLIGPRPERPEFDVTLAAAIPYYHARYWVKPGITGWAQVMYPYGASVEDASEKLSYDLFYIKNFSFWLDLAIVFKTARVVLLGKGR